MMAIIKQLAWLIGSICILYGLALAASLLAFPVAAGAGALDTGHAGASLYITEPKYVFLGRTGLTDARPRVVFIGASNVVVGFKQSEVAAQLPGVEVDNLAVGGSNVTQMAQIV